MYIFCCCVWWRAPASTCSTMCSEPLCIGRAPSWRMLAGCELRLGAHQIPGQVSVQANNSSFNCSSYSASSSHIMHSIIHLATCIPHKSSTDHLEQQTPQRHVEQRMPRLVHNRHTLTLAHLSAPLRPKRARHVHFALALNSLSPGLHCFKCRTSVHSPVAACCK